jgi:hypothetical protein
VSQNTGDNIDESTLDTAGAALALQQQPLPPSTDFNFNNLQWLPIANCCLKVTELTVGMFSSQTTQWRVASVTPHVAQCQKHLH